MIEGLDENILRELKRNSRQKNVEIAHKLKVSEGTVRQRIAKLVRSGVIQRFTIDIATKTGFSAFVFAQTNPQISTDKIIKKLKLIKDVETIYETAGEFDIIAKVVTSSAEQFNYIVERIRTTKGIQKTSTFVVLKIN